MKLADLDEVTRLARSRLKLAAELEELRQAETAMVEITSKAPGSGVLKVSLVAGVYPDKSHPDEVLFDAVIDVLCLGFQARITAIDDRLAALEVKP